MYIEDIIKRLNTIAVRMGNVDYYPAFKVEHELNKLSDTCIKWSEDDFKHQAECIKGSDWEEYYDKTKFKEALSEMIYRHDAGAGINWDTVDYYLEDICARRTAEGMRMDVYNSKL